MFPPPVSRESISSDEINSLTRAYRDAVIYDEADADESLYEGPIVVHANGWIELEGNRLRSPSAVHHIDIYDDEVTERDGDAGGDHGDDGRPGDDDRRTGRFSLR